MIIKRARTRGEVCGWGCCWPQVGVREVNREILR